MNVAYCRVSTVEQHEQRQVKALEKFGINKWYIEKISAKDTNRPKLKEMLDFVREGDTIYIHSFDRLARSTKDLLEIVELLQDKRVNLISTKENLDTTTPTGKLMLTMIAAINTFERENILERQREGIAIAKQQGKCKGGQVKKINESDFSELYDKYHNRHITKTEFAKLLNVSRPTLNKLLKERELQ